MDGDVKSLSDILNFQIHRHIINNAKDSLILSEETHKYIKTLENLLVKMGLEHYNSSEFDYQKDRARILSRANDSSRELQSLLSSFDINLKKE